MSLDQHRQRLHLPFYSGMCSRRQRKERTKCAKTTGKKRKERKVRDGITVLLTQSNLRIYTSTNKCEGNKKQCKTEIYNRTENSNHSDIGLFTKQKD